MTKARQNHEMQRNGTMLRLLAARESRHGSQARFKQFVARMNSLLAPIRLIPTKQGRSAPHNCAMLSLLAVRESRSSNRLRLQLFTVTLVSLLSGHLLALAHLLSLNNPC